MRGHLRVDWSMARDLDYIKAWKAANPEKTRAHAATYRAKNRRKLAADARTYYAENKEQRRAYNAMRMNPHKPDGKIPKDLLLRIRLKCLEMELDPGVTQDMTSAMVQVGLESPDLQRNYLHPDHLSRNASSWSQKWRNSSRVRAKVIEAYESGKLS